MAAVTPGTGGTLKSATAEGQALEALIFLQLQEADAAKNPNGRNFVTGTFNIDNRTFSGTFSFPVDQAIGAGGGLSLSANETGYLTGVTFDEGTGGTFVSTSAMAYALECLMYIQSYERQTAKNPNNLNRVTGTYNSDTGLYAGTFTFPCLMTITAAGALSITPEEYLED